MPKQTENGLAGVRRAGDALKRAEKRFGDARAELAAAVRRARANGSSSLREIAEAAGLSVETVRQMARGVEPQPAARPVLSKTERRRLEKLADAGGPEAEQARAVLAAAERSK